jgi:hypothetical protein
MKPTRRLPVLLLGVSIFCARCSGDGTSLAPAVSAEPSIGLVLTLSLDREVYSVNAGILAHVTCSPSLSDWTLWGQPDSDTVCNPEIEFLNADGTPVDPTDLHHLENDPGNRECIQVTSGRKKVVLLHIERGAVISNDYILGQNCASAPPFYSFSTKSDARRPGVYSVTAVLHVGGNGPDSDAVVRSKSVVFRLVKD